MLVTSLKQWLNEPAPVMGFVSMRQKPRASSETHQLLLSHSRPRGWVMPEASRMPLFAAMGFPFGSCPGVPIELMAHPGGFCMVAVVDRPSQTDSGVSVAEAANNQVLPALFRGGISVAGGNRALTNGSITTVMSSTKLPSGSRVGV